MGIKSKHFLKVKKTILKQMSTVEDQTCNLTKQKLSNNNKLNTLVKYQSTKKKGRTKRNPFST